MNINLYLYVFNITNNHTSDIYSIVMKMKRANILKIICKYCAGLNSDEVAVTRGGQINSKYRTVNQNDTNGM